MVEPKRLKGFPRHDVVSHELLRCRASELDLLRAIGAPTGQTDPHQDDPVFFWDLVWPCGLVTAVAFEQLTEVLTLHLDQADVDHAVRHLGIRPRDEWRWELDAPAAFAAAVPDVPSRGWSVWCERDGAGPIVVGEHLTERDARCWLVSLESDGDDGDAAGVARYRVEPSSG